MMKDPVNKLIMEEIGLTIDNKNRIIDQDTRESITYKDKNMKYSSQNSVTLGHSEMIFDPGSNKNLMTTLFGYYANKIEEEEEGYVSMYYEKPNLDGKNILEAKTDKGLLQSKPYNNESLLYLDVIQQINGAENVDLSEYDADKPLYEEKKNTRKRKPKKFKLS